MFTTVNSEHSSSFCNLSRFNCLDVFKETLTYILKFAPNLQQQIDEFQVYFPLHAFDVGALSGISLQTRPYMRALVNEIRSRYLVNVTTQNDKIKAMTRMTSDFIFNYFIEKTIEALLPKTSSIFNWRYI